MTYKVRWHRYPPCWQKVRSVLYRLTSAHCERCGRYVSPRKFTVHHLGAPYADGRPGNPADKHDIRRENLLMLCNQCHCEVEPCRSFFKQLEKKRSNKRKAHAALHVGTGLMVVQ